MTAPPSMTKISFVSKRDVDPFPLAATAASDTRFTVPSSRFDHRLVLIRVRRDLVEEPVVGHATGMGKPFEPIPVCDPIGTEQSPNPESLRRMLGHQLTQQPVGQLPAPPFFAGNQNRVRRCDVYHHRNAFDVSVLGHDGFGPNSQLFVTIGGNNAVDATGQRRQANPRYQGVV